MKRTLYTSLASLAVVAVVVGVSLSREAGPGSSPQSDVSIDANVPTTDANPLSCTYPATPVEEWCTTIEVDGMRARYALIRTDEPSARTMIFDPGGPGVSILSRHLGDLDAVAVGAHQRGYNLLVIDEPWVVAPYVDECRSALARYLSSATARYPYVAGEEQVRDVGAVCLDQDSPAVMTAERYRQMIETVERTEKLRVERLEGYSFASVRAAYLGATHPDLVVAVGTPFPVGATAAEFFGAMPKSSNVTEIKSGTLALDSAAAYYQMTGHSPQDVKPAAAGRGLWQSDTNGQVSLSRVGYLSEMCHALVGWDEFSRQDPGPDPSLNAQRALHAACSGMTPDPKVVLPVTTCLAVLGSDRQTPWIESKLTEGATIEVLEAGQHGQVTIPDCG